MTSVTPVHPTRLQRAQIFCRHGSRIIFRQWPGYTFADLAAFQSLARQMKVTMSRTTDAGRTAQDQCRSIGLAVAEHPAHRHPGYSQTDGYHHRKIECRKMLPLSTLNITLKS